MTNFLHYAQTFTWAKLLTLNMFSKKVINFALWFDIIHWYGLALFLRDIWWIEML